MAKGITQDCRVLWLFLAGQAGRWWADAAITHHWRPTYRHDDLQGHMEALHKAGFVERRKSGPARCSPYQYAVTSKCKPLPGYQLDGTPATAITEGA